MAQADFGDHEGFPEPADAPRAFPARRIAQFGGAIASVVLVAYLAHWGWDLAMLDLRGVPVIRAPEGPMRVQPEETGGAVISNQGLAVNAIAAGSGAMPPADAVLLAPAPVTLLPDDTPGLPATMPDDTADLAEEGAAIDGSAEAIAAAIAEATAEAGHGSGPEQAASDGPAVPRPRPRPEGAALSRGTDGTTAPVEIVDPEAIAPGTQLVQFGAYDSAADARAEWQRLAGGFPALMADKAMVLQPAESGGRAFWRLRALGFADDAEARRFCAAIDAGNARCIPVTQR